MRFAFDEQQQQLAAIVSQFAAEHAGMVAVRRHSVPGAGYDRELWRGLGVDLGLAGLTIPEDLGGSGAGMVELGVVLEQLGKALVPSPFFATVALGAAALLASDDRVAQERFLPAIATGRTTATLCHAEGPHGVEVETTAAHGSGGWTVSGAKRSVVDGATADLLIVPARDGAGIALFVVSDDQRVVRTPAETLDTTRPVAVVEFDAAPAVRLQAAPDIVQRVLQRAAISLAAESLGVAQWSLDTTVAHVRSRVQFGRPIGSFQAIKHKAADMMMDVEGTRAIVAYAMWALDHDTDNLACLTHLAAAHASDAVFRVAAQMLQLLGGIGYTWEHDAHFYFKRAKSSGLLLGSADEHREAALVAYGI